MLAFGLVAGDNGRCPVVPSPAIESWLMMGRVRPTEPGVPLGQGRHVVVMGGLCHRQARIQRVSLLAEFFDLAR
jgi:hypothetical protein